jgi:hypothetical protein
LGLFHEHPVEIAPVYRDGVGLRKHDLLDLTTPNSTEGAATFPHHVRRELETQVGQGPIGKPSRAWLVARESIFVQKQHGQTRRSQVPGRRGSGRACSYDNDVRLL